MTVIMSGVSRLQAAQSSPKGLDAIKAEISNFELPESELMNTFLPTFREEFDNLILKPSFKFINLENLNE